MHFTCHLISSCYFQVKPKNISISFNSEMVLKQECISVLVFLLDIRNKDIVVEMYYPEINQERKGNFLCPLISSLIPNQDYNS